MIELETLSPSLLEPAQVPLIVAAFGALGVAFGRWTPQPALAPLLTIALWVGPLAWSIPWVSMQHRAVPGRQRLGRRARPAGISCSWRA